HARQVPTVLSVLPAHTGFVLKGLTNGDRLHPQAQYALAVIGMNRLNPCVSQCFLRGAHILAPPLIEVIDWPVGGAGIYELRHGVSELAESRLALAQHLLSPFALGDVADDGVPAAVRKYFGAYFREQIMPVLASQPPL